MKKLIFGFGLLALLLGSGGTPMAEVYKWVDEKGRVTFSDTPPENMNKAKIINLAPDYVPPPATESDPPAAVIKKPNPFLQSPPKVELFTTSWCPACKSAKKYLTSQGVRFREYDVEKDQNALHRKRRLDPRNGVPLAVIGDVKILGFDPGAYERALTRN